MGRLFLIEVLLRLTTGVEMGLLMVGAFAGLLENPQFGGWRSAPRVVAAWISYVAFNLLLAAGNPQLDRAIAGSERMREVLVLLWVLPDGAAADDPPHGAGTRKLVGERPRGWSRKGGPWGQRHTWRWEAHA